MANTENVQKYNPYHDSQGRFSSANGGGGGAAELDPKTAGASGITAAGQRDALMATVIKPKYMPIPAGLASTAEQYPSF